MRLETVKFEDKAGATSGRPGNTNVTGSFPVSEEWAVGVAILTAGRHCDGLSGSSARRLAVIAFDDESAGGKLFSMRVGHRAVLLAVSILACVGARPGGAPEAYAAAAPADEVAAESAGGDKQCSCRSCAHEVCCQAPKGFAPLEERCKAECDTRRWTVKGAAECGKPEACCP